MKLTFIRPALTARRARDALEPTVFSILRGLTPPDIECVLYDERIEEIPLDEPTDLVAMTVETFTAKRAYQIASGYLRRGIPVVMGGYHATLRPDEVLQYATTVVIGDAESIWPRVVEDARRGALERTYENRLPDLGGLRRDRSIYRGKRYHSLAMVEFGRGCRFACDFCSIHAFYGSSLRRRPMGEVLQEIKGLRGRHVCFTDDNLFSDPDTLRALLTALTPLKIRWSCQISLDVAADRDLVRLMARSGCKTVTVGFESLSEANLRQMGKHWNHKFGPYEDLVRVFHDHGIMIWGTFVLGYDHDTVEAFDATLDFAVRSKLFLANFNPLAPTPGARTYDRLKAEGRLINDPWWLHPDYRYGQAMFHPKAMSARQLTEGCYRARTEFNRYRSIMRRGLEFHANLRNPRNTAIYLAGNLINRREVHRKQGSHLAADSEVTPAFVGEAT
ncbi:MAG: B12-binding domain-containing radical SAM protein [Planctomycetota bacterium]